MADFTQSTIQTLLSHQDVTDPGSVAGTALSVASYLWGTIYIYHAYTEAATPTEGAQYKIQIEPQGSGNEDWVTVANLRGRATAVESEALTASEPGGETVIAMASTTNLAVGDIIYIEDTGTLADSEWGEIVTVTTNTSVTLLDGLANAKDSSDVLYNEAQRWAFSLHLGGVSRVRVCALNFSGVDVHCLSYGLFATDLE